MTNNLIKLVKSIGILLLRDLIDIKSYPNLIKLQIKIKMITNTSPSDSQANHYTTEDTPIVSNTMNSTMDLQISVP